MARKKAAAKVATPTAPASGTKRKSEDWTAGDRIGKLSLATLRDLRITAEMRGAVEVDDFVRVAELLEAVMEQAHDSENDRMIVAEELVDVMKRCEEQRVKAVEEKEEAEREHEEEIASVKEAQANALKDHEEDMRAVNETVRELHARATKAEADLAAAVKNGHGMDAEAAARIKELEAMLAGAEACTTAGGKAMDVVIAERDATIAALETALAHARSINPMRARGKR